MNKAFTKSKKIVLDPNWHLTPDSDNGIVLTFHEMRERDKLEKVDGKQIKTGEKETYLFEEKWYFTRIVQALKEYAEETQNNSGSLEKILKKQKHIEKLLTQMDREFKQFG